MSETKPSVFLSYAWDDDQRFVRKLREDLEATGFTVWQDERDLPSRGPDLPAELRAVIDRADRFVPVIGPVAADKGNTPGTNLYVEWNYARSACRAVTAILRKGEPSLIPADFGGESLWFDFRNNADYGSKLADLLDRLGDPAQVATLYHVPELPRGFLPRESYLADLRKRVLGQTAQAVITSKQQTAALQGMGGVGKSVLAAAFARDCSVRRRFYDGVFWLTIGIEPSESRLVDQMKGIGAALGDDVGQYHSLTSAGSRLAEILKDRASLLILDDVWDIRHAEQFRNAVGNRCGLLATTRDGRIAADLSSEGGEPVRIDVLSEDDALILLAQTAKLSGPDQLPVEAPLIANECGYLAFALVQCGSSAGEGTLWADILDALQEQDLTYLQRQLPDYPYPDMLKALKVSIDLLEKRDASVAGHYRELAIFPADTVIPEEAIVTFWTNTNGVKPREARQMIADLYNLSLIKVEGEAPHRRITLHDLQHAYLSAEAGERLTELHLMLLAAYQKHYGIGEWSEMPVEEPYLWRALAAHLKGSGRIDELHDLLLDADYLQAKCIAVGIGPLLDDYKAVRSDEDIWLVTSALMMGAHVLAHSPRELGTQVRERLWNHRGRFVIEQLCKALASSSPDILRPLSEPVLTQAGGVLLRTMQRHSGPVNGVLKLSDGRLLSWSGDKTLRLWNTEGELLRTLEGHTNIVRSALELSDGRLLSRSDDKTLRLWNTAGEPLRILEGHTNIIFGALELSDGRLLSWSADKTLRLWNAEGEPLRTLEGHSGVVGGALKLSDGRFLSWSGDLRLWSAEGEPLRRLEGHIRLVDGALELSDGRLLSWSVDNTLRLWNAEGEPLHRLEGHTDIVRGALELPDSRLLSWSDDKTLRLWSADGQPLRTLEGHISFVKHVAELSDGRLLSWSADKTLRLWGADGQPLRKLEGHMDAVHGALELSDGTLLSWARKIPSSRSVDYMLRLWSAEGEPLRTFEGHTHQLGGALELSNGKLLSWSDDKTLRLWSVEGKPLRTIEERIKFVSHVLVLSDGRLLSWSSAKSPYIWSADGEPLRTVEGHTNSMKGMLELSDGRLLSWSSDKTLRLWNAEGDPLNTLEGHTDAVRGALELSDGRLLSWAVGDPTLWLWSARGKALGILKEHFSWVRGALEMSDGRLLSWSADKTLRLWSAEGEPLRTLEGHTDAVHGAMELSDSRLLSWARKVPSFRSVDYMLRLWNTEGDLLDTLAGHTRRMRGALELSNGKLLSWSDDKTLRLWSADGQPLRTLEGHTDGANGVLELSNERLLSWSSDNTPRIWSGEGWPLRTLEGHTDGVNGVLELSDGRLLSWSIDGTLRLWGAESEPLSVFYGDAPIICCVSFQAGRRIAAGDNQGRFILFEIGE